MFLDNIFGTNQKDNRTQLHFRDEGTFEFRTLPIEDTFLVEKVKDEIVRGWKHFYRNQFPFPGYKGMRSDLVTLSYDRDIILDPYGLVNDDRDNPEKKTVQGQPGGVRAWLIEIGEARRLKMMANRSKTKNYNMVIIFLGSALMIELLIIGIGVLANRGG